MLQVVAERKPAFEKILRYLLRSDAAVHEHLGWEMFTQLPPVVKNVNINATNSGIKY